MADPAIHRPTSLDELTALVGWAVAVSEPLEIVGAGSKRALGRPTAIANRLDLSRLSGITMYEPGELVMTALPGTPLLDIERELSQHNQEFAFEPADWGWILGGEAGRQTIGGVFACNLAGPRRLKAGAARDHLLGLHCVTGQGKAIKTGGRVVKNVTGYDLCKLLTGSFGTLAVLTELTFKVLPRGETEGTLLVTGQGEAELLSLLRLAMGTSHDVSSAACLPPLAAGRSSVDALHSGRTVAALRLEGPAPSVAYRIERLRKELAAPGVAFEEIQGAASRTLWTEIRDVRLLSRERALWRLSMPPSAGSELARWAAEFAPERLWDWSGGLLWLAPRASWADAGDTLRQALQGRGGHALLVRGPEEVRARVPVFEPLPEPLAALTRRVKASFDPRRVLNPGRMYADV